MVKGRSWALLVLVVAAGALAGCVDDSGDEVDPGAPAASTGASPGASPVPGATKRALTEVSGSEAVFAPTWEAGQGWTYQVAGSLVGEPYTVTIGVHEVAGDQYRLASDNDREEELRLVTGESLFLNGVRKETLAIMTDEQWEDVIGFTRATGETWRTHVFKQGFDLTKSFVGDIEHAAGTAPGIRTEGRLNAHSLIVEYASDAKGIVFLEWQENGTTVISYTLTSFQESGVTGLFTWEILLERNMAAQWTLEAIGATNWDSDGSGDLLFVTVHCTVYSSTNPVTSHAPQARTAAAKLFDPAHNEAVSHICTPLEASFESMRLDDMAGRWNAVGVSDGPRIEINAYQIGFVQL